MTARPDADGSRRPIVAFAHHPWDEPEWMNRQQLLSRLGQRRWPVAYTTGALDWWQRGTARWNAAPWFDDVSDHDHIRDVQPGRLDARWQRFPAFERLAIARHARHARGCVARPGERIIALLFHPQFYPYIEALKPCDIAFHAYDAYAGQPDWTATTAAYQAALVAEAGLVTASSEAIARQLGDPKVQVLPNGADVDAFSRASSRPEPDDLRPIPRPRLGYVGAINRKVDLALVAAIAVTRPDWHWVLVGRVERTQLLADDYNGTHFRLCETLPNVHFLGQKDRRAVPAYVGHMDINTMCYRARGEGWWTSGSPLKLHEYLASGSPVISAPIEAVLPFSQVVRIADDADQWYSAIESMLASHDRAADAERRGVALKNSWDVRVETLEGWLYEHFL